MKDIEHIELLRRRRIDLYSSISVGLHDSEELQMDAGEIPGGGWTARNGDEDDRLYGQAAWDYIRERVERIRAKVDSRFCDYRDEGGNSQEVIADVTHSLTVIVERQQDVARRADKAQWDFEEDFCAEAQGIMKTATHQETRDHYVEVRDILKRAGWDSHRIASELGVTRQTSYQYGFDPGTRGSRVIPADRLDRLRELATAAEAERHERGFPAFLPRAEHLWLVFGLGMELLLETTSPWRAAWHAARHCGVAMPGRDNAGHRNRQLTADDELCVEWVEQRHGGLITKADVMEIAAVDEYLAERVGHEHHGWRIQPTTKQVEALKDLHLSRWSHAA